MPCLKGSFEMDAVEYLAYLIDAKNEKQINDAANAAYWQIRQYILTVNLPNNTVSKDEYNWTKRKCADTVREMLKRKYHCSEQLIIHIQNTVDMIQGCLNRICVTDSVQEHNRLNQSVLYELTQLRNLVLCNNGFLDLPKYEETTSDLL